MTATTPSSSRSPPRLRSSRARAPIGPSSTCRTRTSNYTSECVTDDTNLNALREASLKCIASYAHTHPSFGTVDGSYREYDGDGICLGVGGDIHRDQGFRRTFLTAEPLNAESNFAFDVLACHSSSFVHKAASLLAIGSFAMHASGDGQDSWMGKLDVAPMRCSVAAMLAEAIERTSGDTTVTVPNGGLTYVFDATMKNRADPIADAVTECNLDESSSTNLGAQLDEAIAATPRLQLSIGLLAGGLLNACYGSAAAIINSQGDELGMTPDEQAAAIAFQSGDSLTPSSPACAEGLSTMFEFIDAAKYQENVVDGVCATQNCHHIWHMKHGAGVRVSPRRDRPLSWQRSPPRRRPPPRGRRARRRRLPRRLRR